MKMHNFSYLDDALIEEDVRNVNELFSNATLTSKEESRSNIN